MSKLSLTVEDWTEANGEWKVSVQVDKVGYNKWFVLENVGTCHDALLAVIKRGFVDDVLRIVDEMKKADIYVG